MDMVFAKNKRAYYDFFVEDKLEAGISLKGNEVSSIKNNGCSINGAWIRIENGEAFVYGMNIPKNEKSGVFAEDPLRIKKLLLHKKEIAKFNNAVEIDGKSIVPLSVYVKDGKVKMEIALCTGKKKYDKRETIAKRDVDKKIASALKDRNRGQR